MKKHNEEKIVVDMRGKVKKKFIKTMDYDWFRLVAQTPGKGPLIVAIGLYYWASIFKKNFDVPFELSVSRLAREFGISESSAYRGFKRLVRSKLVSVKLNSGKKSTITLHKEALTLPPDAGGATKSKNTLFENLDDGKAVAPKDFEATYE